MDEAELLHELEPTVERLFERHLATTKEWFPHEHIPYSRGRDFDAGAAWSEADADLGGAVIDDAARSSLVVNLLTEDNLPYYFRTIERTFGEDGPWGAWSKRWTAEEGRHSMVDLRLPDGDPRRRSGGPRAGPDGAGVQGPGARAGRRRPRASSTSPCRSWRPASPTATPGACSATGSATT